MIESKKRGNIIGRGFRRQTGRKTDINDDNNNRFRTRVPLKKTDLCSYRRHMFTGSYEDTPEAVQTHERCLEEEVSHEVCACPHIQEGTPH